MPMKKAKNIYLIIIFGGIFCYSWTYAQTMNARFTTVVYTYEQQENDSSSANHLRAYQLAQLTIGKMGLPNLSFHTYLQLSGDLLDEAKSDPRLWIYNCYLNLKDIADAVDLSVGRQRIYAGVGYGTVDGLQVLYHMKDYFKIKMYAGMLAPLRKSDDIEELKTENLSYGFHLTSSKINKLNLGLSFTNLSRPQVKYSSTGLYTGDFRIDYPLPALQKQLLGLDVSSDILPKVRLNGRLDFNLRSDEVKRGEFGARYFINRDLEIGLDYIYRMPYVDYNSIFSVFEMNANQELAFHTSYRWSAFYFTLQFADVLFEGDDSQRFGAGCSWKSYYLGFHHRSGYGGNSDGLTANVSYPIRDQLRLSLSSYFTSYRLFETDSREQAIAGAAGVNWMPVRNLTIQAETQLLKNERFSHDIRFYFRGSYALFMR